MRSLRRYRRLCALVATLAGGACQHGGSAGGARAVHLPGHVRLSGRFVPDPANPTIQRFAWTNSAIEVRFSGPPPAFLLARNEDDPHAQYYALALDNEPPQPVSLGGDGGEVCLPAQAPGVSGQSLAGPHRLRLTRLSEAFLGEAQFLGLKVPVGTTLLPQEPPRGPQLVFVGDSITAGYGNLGYGPNCPFSPGQEDGTAAYAALAARELGGEATVLAWSGKGLWRNRDPNDPHTMAELWRRALPESAWTHDEVSEGAAIDAALVNLGTNDASTPGFDEAAFGQGMERLLTGMRRAYPRAHLVALVGPMLNNQAPIPGALDQVRGRVLAAVAARSRDGDTNLSFLEFASQTGSMGFGCDYHPNLATHRSMAAQLAAHLAPRLPPRGAAVP